VSDSPDDFERVFNDCYEPVLRYVARRVARDAVQDVVSDTFLIAWRRHGDLRGEPLPWLLGIARRVAATQRRATARRERLSERLRAEHPPAEPAAGLESDDPRLAQALACLPDRDREALVLIAWDGLDHRTAAQVMGCTTGSLTVRLHRARRRLARALQDVEPGRSGLAEQTGSTL
jgi:RNA polymerase sigma-70 factor (ECF subfamily)